MWTIAASSTTKKRRNKTHTSSYMNGKHSKKHKDSATPDTTYSNSSDIALDKNEPVMKAGLVKLTSLLEKRNISVDCTDDELQAAFADDTALLGKPTPAELASSGFGQTSKNHAFVSEKHFDHTLLYLYKSGFLSDTDLHVIRSVHPLYNHLWITMHRARSVNFSTLREYDRNYAQQESIPTDRVRKFLAAAVHYNLHIPSVIRYVGGNYTAEYRDVDTILRSIKNIVPDDLYLEVKRVLTLGAPTILKGESSRQNFEDYRKYGNHSSIKKHFATAQATMNKETRNQYVIPFPCWLARFTPNIHLTPQALVIKPGKNPRLVFDGTFFIYWYSRPVNSWTSMKNEPEIIYGTAFLRHLIRI